MSKFIPWDSQPLDEWASKYASGKFIDLDGHKTHYIELGSGKPLILVHGFNYDSYTWASNMEALAANNKVYALDLWGQGYSTREPLDYGFELFSSQLLQFMDALDISKASLAGHSMGGGTVIYFSLHHADRVEKLVLVDSVGIKYPLPLKGKLFQLPGLSEFVLSLKTNAVRRMNMESNWILNKELITDSYFEEAMRTQKIEGTTKGLLSILRKDFFGTLNEEIEQLGRKRIPTLIFWGSESNMPPLKCGQEMHRLMPSSKLVILNNAGHLSNFDQSARFNQLALEFLSEDGSENHVESDKQEEDVASSSDASS